MPKIQEIGIKKHLEQWEKAQKKEASRREKAERKEQALRDKAKRKWARVERKTHTRKSRRTAGKGITLHQLFRK